MKKVLICLIIGFLFASIIFLKYKGSEELTYEKIYMLQIGAYTNFENVVKVTKTLDNYIVKEEDGKHKVIVAITKNENNLNKLQAFYEKNDNNIYIREEETNNEKFLDFLTKYDYLLEKAEKEETIKNIVKEIINKYNELKGN